MTVSPINETGNTISIASFTKQSTADIISFEMEQELVNTDVALDHAVQHRTPIGYNLTKSYKVTTVRCYHLVLYVGIFAQFS